MDLIKSGIIPRKLTRKEARVITKKVMATGIKNPNTRVMLAILKTIDVTNRK